jgi:hypothetical protein
MAWGLAEEVVPQRVCCWAPDARLVLVCAGDAVDAGDARPRRLRLCHARRGEVCVVCVGAVAKRARVHVPRRRRPRHGLPKHRLRVHKVHSIVGDGPAGVRVREKIHVCVCVCVWCVHSSPIRVGQVPLGAVHLSLVHGLSPALPVWRGGRPGGRAAVHGGPTAHGLALARRALRRRRPGLRRREPSCRPRRRLCPQPRVKRCFGAERGVKTVRRRRRRRREGAMRSKGRGKDR